MANPTPLIVKIGSQIDCSSFSYKDMAVYGGSYTARNLLAIVLFVTRTTKDGVRTLQGNIPDSANPLVVANWQITSTDDGLIEKIEFAINAWSGIVAYAAGDIIYDTVAQAYFKCTTGHTNQEPPNLSYWTMITVDSLYTTELANGSAQMVITFGTDLNVCRISDRKRKEYERVADQFLSTLNLNMDLNQADEIDGVMESAFSALANNRPYEAEEIIRTLTNEVLNYGSLT